MGRDPFKSATIHHHSQEHAKFLRMLLAVDRLIEKLRLPKVTKLRSYMVDLCATVSCLKLSLDEVSAAHATLVVACRDCKVELPRERLLAASSVSRSHVAVAVFEVSTRLLPQRTKFSSAGYAKYLGNTIPNPIESMQDLVQVASASVALGFVAGDVPTAMSAAYFVMIHTRVRTRPLAVVQAKMAKTKQDLFTTAASAAVAIDAAKLEAAIASITPHYHTLVTHDAF